MNNSESNSCESVKNFIQSYGNEIVKEDLNILIAYIIELRTRLYKIQKIIEKEF